jgi:soluble lytic murein transglycosylase-like protein
LHADHHEVEGAKLRLYVGGGFIEMDAAQVQGFETEEPKPVVPAVPVINPVTEPPSLAVASPRALADAAADKYGLPRKLVRSVIAAESGFQPKAVSPKGAIGLMQLMPTTARSLGADPHDPAQNVDAGTRHLRDLLEKYKGLWHALAAYNAGEGALQKHNGNIPPYPETIQYINKIDRDLKKSGD